MLYARVSGDDRGKDGRNLAGQLEMCRKYAQEHGYRIVAELQEDERGASGAEIDLPQLNKALDMARAGDYDIFVVREIDRLSRNLAKQLMVEEELKHAGVEIEYVLGEYPDTPEGSLMKNIKASVAEYERLKLAERNQRGKRNMARSGKVVGGGRMPYGYMYKQGAFEIVEAEAKIIRQVYSWYLYDENGSGPLTAYGIAQKLSDMRVPTPGERPHDKGKPRTRPNGIWSECYIYRLLVNPTYKGEWHYGKNIGWHNLGGKRPASEVITVHVPLIVDPVTWQAAQEKSASNRKRSRRNSRREYLLRGLVKCDCGSAMVGHVDSRQSHHGVYYYVCNKQMNQYPVVPKNACRNRCRGDVLEQIAWRYVMDIFSDEALFEQKLREAQQAETESVRPLREQLELVNELIAQAETEARQLASTLATVQRGGIIDKAICEQADAVEVKHRALAKRRNELVAEIEATQPLSNEDINRALEFRWTVCSGMQNPTTVDKKRVFEIFRLTVTVKTGGKKAAVAGRFPLGAQTFDLTAITD